MRSFSEQNAAETEFALGGGGDDLFDFTPLGTGVNQLIGGDGDDLIVGLGQSPTVAYGGPGADTFGVGVGDAPLDGASGTFGAGDALLPSFSALDELIVVLPAEPGDLRAVDVSETAAAAPYDVGVARGVFPELDPEPLSILFVEATGDTIWDYRVIFPDQPFRVGADVTAETLQAELFFDPQGGAYQLVLALAPQAGGVLNAGDNAPVLTTADVAQDGLRAGGLTGTGGNDLVQLGPDAGLGGVQVIAQEGLDLVSLEGFAGPLSLFGDEGPDLLLVDGALTPTDAPAIDRIATWFDFGAEDAILARSDQEPQTLTSTALGTVDPAQAPSPYAAIVEIDPAAGPDGLGQAPRFYFELNGDDAWDQIVDVPSGLMPSGADLTAGDLRLRITFLEELGAWEQVVFVADDLREFEVALFDQAFYLGRGGNADLAAAGVTTALDGFAHWFDVGLEEGREYSPLLSVDAMFDEAFYLEQDASTQTSLDVVTYDTALEHYVREGSALDTPDGSGGRQFNPNPFFDPAAYRAANPDIAAAVDTNGQPVDPFVHYLQFGEAEILAGDRTTDGLVGFDPVFYAAENPDVADFVNAGPESNLGLITYLQHFLESGLAEGRPGLAEADAGARSLDAETDALI